METKISLKGIIYQQSNQHQTSKRTTKKNNNWNTLEFDYIIVLKKHYCNSCMNSVLCQTEKKFGKIKKLKKIGKLQKNFIVPDLSCIICNGDMFPSTSFPAKIFLEKKRRKNLENSKKMEKNKNK